jgi:hypothetical protein
MIVFSSLQLTFFLSSPSFTIVIKFWELLLFVFIIIQIIPASPFQPTSHNKQSFNTTKIIHSFNMQINTLFLALFAAATVSAVPCASQATAVKAVAQAAAVNATAGAADFGTCNPAMSFAFGRPGRKATEGTFLPVDPTIAAGQEDALNPNIITNAICNQLINVCGVAKASAGEATCLTAKADVAALTTKDQTTADAFNSALGVSA